MPIQPIDYSSGTQQAFLTGLQGAGAVQNIMANRQQMQQQQMQQQRLQAFQQAWGPAYQSRDPNQIDAVLSQFPEYQQIMQGALKFRGDQHSNDIGNLASNLRMSFEFGGPQAAIKMAQQNPELLQSMGSSPEELTNLLMHDPTKAQQIFDHIGMNALGTKDYFSTLNDQNTTAETGRHNQATEGLTARGQDVTSRGQDLTYNAALRGQNITARGQDLTFQSQGLDRAQKQQQLDTQQGQLYQKKIADYGKDASNLQSLNDQYDRTIKLANDILKMPTQKITGSQGVFPNAPGSAAADTEASRENLKTQLGIMVTNELRNASKTGSTGFGNMTNQELNNIQNSVGSLDTSQSNTQFRANVQKILGDLQKSKTRVNNYMSYSYPKSFVNSIPDEYKTQQSQPTSPRTTKNMSDEDLLSHYSGAK